MTDIHDQDPISLDELARAFAQVMGTPSPDRAAEGPQPTAAEAAMGPDELQPEPSHEQAVAADESLGDDSGPVTPLGILEAMLFVGDRDNRPLTAARAAELMRGVEPGEIGPLIEELIGVTRRAAALTTPRRIPTATASPFASHFIRSASSSTAECARPGFRKRRSTCWPL